jgi:hypothetical protein
MTWSLRVVKTISKDEDYYEIREVYYDPMGKLMGHCPATVSGESVEEIAEYLQWMLDAIKKRPIKSEEFKGGWEK